MSVGVTFLMMHIPSPILESWLMVYRHVSTIMHIILAVVLEIYLGSTAAGHIPMLPIIPGPIILYT